MPDRWPVGRCRRASGCCAADWRRNETATARESILHKAMTFHREKLKHKAAELAGKGVYVGTSSWKYPGWCGMVYDESRYITRGKFAKSRFERDCLAEYAETFKTVCVDAGRCGT